MPGAKGGGRRALGLVAAALTVTGAALLGGGALLSGATPPVPSPDSARAQPPVTARPVLLRSEPRRLDVPRIGVRVRLSRLGLNADGTVQVPPVDRPEQAGWYARGYTPGERGAAVILGHVDGGGRKGVFYELGRLRPGDAISVTRADGSVAAFTVQSVEQVAKRRFPAQRVYGPLDHAGLRLVTCGGGFDRGSGHYTDNIIVYARLK
ncbi:class F sortase [Spongiactinospora gelatinilytica]|uniref:Class F sortase n=1 Tax=Spongiactinospora gelatinilytica TaxID=2666298 RepID=A0A2W2GUG0_9ACTN|nr:class F sortase [Spongiactinospora gelatinilytica]PZG40958.1 class F sortase [Spongiactinospora gelatinilytica]